MTQNNQKNLVEISFEDISTKITEILARNIVVWRRNANDELVTIPVEKLQRYIGEGFPRNMTFLLEKDWQDKITDKHQVSTGAVSQKDSPMESVRQYGNVTEQANHFKNISIVEREEILDKSIENLSELTKKTEKIDLKAITDMVEVIAVTFYANHANLHDTISTENIRDNLQGVLIKTNWVVQILLDIFSQRLTNYKDLLVISEIDTGSWTIDHLNRVLLEFINFCTFYNYYIDKGFITKDVRSDFNEKYKRYYKKKYAGDVSLEVVFQNGVRRIGKEEMKNYAIGALLYDIGKVSDIEYHDSESGYDENIVHKHVLNSYNMIIKAKVYPFYVAIMAAFHHEYYGGKGSYNYTNPILSKLSQKKLTDENFRYFISYDENDFKNRTALAFFPCKILEIIDIYDALVYKRKNTVIQSLTILKKEFITKSLKIDPILFRIFLEYKKDCGYIQPGELVSIDSIIY